MVFLLSLVVRVLVRLLGARGTDDGSQDLEILVLGHQLRVLQRKAGPPKFRVIDRALLAVASRSHGTAGPPSSSPRRTCAVGTASW